MPVHKPVNRLLERRRVQRTGHGDLSGPHRRDLGTHAVGEPEPPLHHGERHRAGGRHRWGGLGRWRPGVVDEARHLRQGGLAIHHERRWGGTPRGADPFEQVEQQQGVAAEGKEVVVGVGVVLQTEHLSPQRPERPVHRLRDGPPIAFAGGGSGENAQPPGVRHHIGGELVADPRSQVVGRHLTLHRRVQPSIVSLNHQGVADTGVGTQHVLDLAQLHPKPPHLDLGIDAAEIHERPVRTATCQITGAVQPCGLPPRFGVVYEGQRRGLRIVEVTIRDVPGDPDLAHAVVHIE